MDLEKIEKLVNIIEKSSMLEFSIQEGDTKIKMSRRGSAGAPGEPLTVVKTRSAGRGDLWTSIISYLLSWVHSTRLRRRMQRRLSK